MAINNFNDNWGPYTHTEVENAIKAKIAELEALINQGVADGSIGLDQLSNQIKTLLSKANTALQSQEQANWNESSSSSPAFIKNKPAVVNDLNQTNSGGVLDARQGKTLKDLIDGLQATLNTITEDGNVQNAIDTFNEVVAFLNGINNNSGTLAAALLNKVDKDGNKVLSTEDYTTAEKTKLAGIEAGAEVNTIEGIIVNGTEITPDSSTKKVSINAVGKSAYQSYVDTTDDDPVMEEDEWVASLKGEKGDTGNVTVSDGVAQISIINDMTTGGTGDAMSAEMGLLVKREINSLYISLNRLYSKLASLAFLSAQDKADAEPTALNWNVPQVTLTFTNNIAHTTITDDENNVLSGTLLLDKGSTLNLIIKPETGYVLSSVTVDGVAATDNLDGTFSATLSNIQSNATIVIAGNSAYSAKAHAAALGYAATEDLVFWLDGFMPGNTAGSWTDLVGGVDFPNHGATYNANGGYWSFDGVDDYMGYADGTGAHDLAFDPTTHTIEGACYATGDFVLALLSTSNSSNNGANSHPDSISLNVIYNGWANGVFVDGTNNVWGLTYSSGNQVLSINKARAYYQGSALSSLGVNHWAGCGGGRLIGCASTYSTPGTSTPQYFKAGKMFSVRIYSRILTAEEILQNQRVDNARFSLNLTLPS